MNYKKHRILKSGHIELSEINEEGKVHGRVISPNGDVPDWPKIKEDEDFEKYRTQENAKAYEAKLAELEPTTEELEEREKKRKEKQKRQKALDRLIDEKVKEMENEEL